MPRLSLLPTQQDWQRSLDRWRTYMRTELNAQLHTASDWQWQQRLPTVPNTLAVSSKFRTAGVLAPPQPRPEWSDRCLLALLPGDRPLRFDPRQLLYTDGSKMDTFLGASVYDGPSDTVHCVMPTGHDSQLNTVPKRRAPPSTLHCSRRPAHSQHHNPYRQPHLHPPDTYTQHCPNRYRVHKHKHILKLIVHSMLSRQGTTTFYKVRAHIGGGNELADKGAKAAAHAHAQATEEPEEEADLSEVHHRAQLHTYDNPITGQPGIAASWLRYPVQPSR